MDPRYNNYYPSAHDSSSSSSSSAAQHPDPRRGYARTPEQASPTPSPVHPSYSYSPASAPAPYHPHGAPYSHQQPPAYHSSPQTINNSLPPLAHGQAYSRDVTRHDVPSNFAGPSLGPTLHDLPFAASRASSSGGSGRSRIPHWGSAQSAAPESRTPPLPYDRSATYPPPSRHGSQHPSLSLSHSTTATHLIPTPAQTAQAYHNYPSGTSAAAAAHSMLPSSSSAPVVASIPPAASGSSPSQERFYCDKCDKSFGRQHDKKRHYESTHLQQSHMCRFCTKSFSRNDSLKRHQDNGCDKDPEFNP